MTFSGETDRSCPVNSFCAGQERRSPLNARNVLTIIIGWWVVSIVATKRGDTIDALRNSGNFTCTSTSTTSWKMCALRTLYMNFWWNFSPTKTLYPPRHCLAFRRQLETIRRGKRLQWRACPWLISPYTIRTYREDAVISAQQRKPGKTHKWFCHGGNPSTGNPSTDCFLEWRSTYWTMNYVPARSHTYHHYVQVDLSQVDLSPNISTTNISTTLIFQP